MFLHWTDPFSADLFPLVLQMILLASVVNVACALVGCFLLLRRMSMMGDAISHAVLPGLVLAFLFSESLNIVPLFIGAVVAGIVTTFLTQTLHRYGGLATDASMGVVFTSLFALGVVLVKIYASKIHFDTACIYEGSLLLMVLESVDVAGLEIPRQTLVVGPVALLNLGVICLLWKELKLSTFDPGLATSMGFSAQFLHYLLMTLVALTAVASFKTVGSILVVAMLIIPAATAHLLVKRLASLLLIACGLGVLVAAVGAVVAVGLNVSPPGMMAVVAGGFYVVAALFSPSNGVVARLAFQHRTTQRILREDLLAMLYRVEEVKPARQLSRHDALEAIGGGWRAPLALRSTRRRGQVTGDSQHLRLTDEGRREASQHVRTHRLWETYLVEELGLALDHVHEPAHRVEHFIDEGLRDQLIETLPQTSEDPHGREIPG
jgi:manganese/zinc/iron transport system permease protein